MCRCVYTCIHVYIYASDLVERVVAAEAVVLHESQDSNLIVILAIFGILHDLPCLQRGGREGGR